MLGNAKSGFTKYSIDYMVGLLESIWKVVCKGDREIAKLSRQTLV